MPSPILIFWPIFAFSWKAMSTSTLVAVMHHAIPPTTLSNGERAPRRARKYPAATSSSQISSYRCCASASDASIALDLESARLNIVERGSGRRRRGRERELMGKHSSYQRCGRLSSVRAVGGSEGMWWECPTDSNQSEGRDDGGHPSSHCSPSLPFRFH